MTTIAHLEVLNSFTKNVLYPAFLQITGSNQYIKDRPNLLGKSQIEQEN